VRLRRRRDVRARKARRTGRRAEPARVALAQPRRGRHALPIATSPAPAARGFSLRDTYWPLLLLLPLALIALLRGAPGIDERWENHQAHFWLVLVTAAVCLVLAVAITEGARRRRDARLLLIGLAFVVSAGFLGLHALATPGVALSGRNAGFVLATPVGLILSGILAGLSAVEYKLQTSLWIVRHARLLLGLVLALIVAWGAVSLAEVGRLSRPVAPSEIDAPLGAFAAAGVVAYAFAALGYFRVYARRGSGLAFAVAFAFALLAEALAVSVLSLATSWQLSWWEWHGLMVVGFLAIGAAAWREWNEERFSALYLDETLRGHKEVTVLFADLAGFTPFTEAHGSADVHSMLMTYFGRLAPMIRDEFDGEVAEFVGDQIFAVFNKAGDQPDHAVRAARAGLALQRVAAEIRAESGHPHWPRFRVGINTGEVLAGVVGDRGHRIHGVFGDTVNLGSRLEGQSPVDGVMIGAATYAQLPQGVVAERQHDLHVKGKAEPVVAYVLRSVPEP
jgi:class 3 adenylate cyclase